MRDTEIAAVGNVPAGTHFCLFYESPKELAELLVSYLKAGLENNESCLWVTSEPMTSEAATHLLRKSVEDLDALIDCGQLEILDQSQWYTTSGQFDGFQVLERWLDKEEEALRQGFARLRFAGDTSWLHQTDWQRFVDYEAIVDDVIEQHQIIAVCAWPLRKRSVPELIEVASNHQFAMVESAGEWCRIESRKRKQLTEAFRDRDEQLLVRDRAMEATTEGISIVDARRPGHPVVYANRSFEALTGYKEADLLGQNMRLLQGPDTDAAVISEMCQAIQAENECHVEVLNYRKDGSPFWSRVAITPVRDDLGHVTHFIGVHTDVTRRREAEMALREQHRQLQATLQELEDAQGIIVQQERLLALGQMASGIAHDLNNTLSPILGYSDLLLADQRIPADAHEWLQAIATAARDAAAVVARLREFYRESDHPDTREPVQLDQLVPRVVMLVRPQWRDEAQRAGRSIQLDTDLQPVPVVCGKDSKLREVLTNLILNAVDAIPDRGTITVRVYPSGEAVVLEVSDTGIGMSQDVKKRCCDPFFTTKTEQGVGLGLSVCHGIVTRYGGQIQFESEPGQGTIVRIVLPGSPKAVHTSHKEPEVELPTARVLYVDDDPRLRQSIVELLTQLDQEVDVAASGTEGLEKAIANDYDLIITDLGMPDLDGATLTRRIKRDRPQTPVVMLTGWGDSAIPKDLPIGKRPDHVLAKPITLSGLRSVLTKVL